MPLTYEQLATVTLTTTASSIAFTNLSTSHTDLVIRGSLSSSNTGSLILLANNDGGTRYGSRGLYGNGTNPLSLANFSGTKGYLNNSQPNSTNYFTPITINLMNYSNSSYNKIVLARAGTNSETGLYGITWQISYPITSLSIQCDAGFLFSAGSSLSLYGIAMYS